MILATLCIPVGPMVEVNEMGRGIYRGFELGREKLDQTEKRTIAEIISYIS